MILHYFPDFSKLSCLKILKFRAICGRIDEYENESRVILMKYVKQLAIILAICLLGELTVRFLPLGFPGNIMAMLILAILLVVRVVKEEHIRETSNFLLEVIGLFIVPVSVSMMAHFELIGQIWWQLFLVSLVTLLLTFASSAFTIRLTMRLINRKKGVQS